MICQKWNWSFRSSAQSWRSYTITAFQRVAVHLSDNLFWPSSTELNWSSSGPIIEIEGVLQWTNLPKMSVHTNFTLLNLCCYKMKIDRKSDFQDIISRILYLVHTLQFWTEFLLSFSWVLTEFQLSFYPVSTEFLLSFNWVFTQFFWFAEFFAVFS